MLAKVLFDVHTNTQSEKVTNFHEKLKYKIFISQIIFWILVIIMLIFKCFKRRLFLQ